MVKIQEEDLATGNGLKAKSDVVKGKQREALGSDSGPDSPRPDLELVAEARQLLKGVYESDPEESEQIYSKRHYEELMEAEAPFTCWRYLLHRDLNVKQAVELMKQALVWRKANQIDVMEPRDLIKDAWLRAPIGFVGRTKGGHDLIYVIVKNYRKCDPSLRQTIRDFISYVLFSWDRKHRYDLDKLVLVVDNSETGFRNTDLDFAAWLVSIRDYVPARVHAVNFVGVPLLIRPLIRLIISWLPERFRRITHCGTYEELVGQNVEASELPQEVGGLAPNTWRLAPKDAPWAHESGRSGDADKLRLLSEACSFNVDQETLDQLYQMQRDHERK